MILEIVVIRPVAASQYVVANKVMLFYKKHLRQGQSLIEAVVAIAVVSLVLVGLISAVTFSLANVQFSRNKAGADKYAQEVIEWLRSERETLGWSDFYDKAQNAGTTYCLNDLASWLVAGACTPGSTISGTIFTREVFLDGNGGIKDQVSVKVTVSWQQGSRRSENVVNTYLNKWQ